MFFAVNYVPFPLAHRPIRSECVQNPPPAQGNSLLISAHEWANPDTPTQAGGDANRNAERLRAKSSVRSVLFIATRVKSEGRKKAEARTALGLRFRSSDFGTRPSFGPRPSNLPLPSPLLPRRRGGSSGGRADDRQPEGQDPVLKSLRALPKDAHHQQNY